MKERRIDLDGLALAALEHGPSSAPPLLALHGWLDNAASFSTLAGHLPERRLIALDLPGHGHAGHLPEGVLIRYHFVDAVAAVLAAMDALGLDQCDLLGHSMGAGIACLVAAAAPQRIRRLALIEGLGPLPDSAESTLDRFRNAMTAVSGHERRLRVFDSIEQAALARERASGLPAALARPIIERGLAESEGGFVWRSDPRLTQASPVRLDEQQAQRLLGGIACPVELLLAEPETPYLPGAMMRARAACVPDIRVRHMHGHHHLHLEHPTEVAAGLERFLAGDG